MFLRKRNKLLGAVCILLSVLLFGALIYTALLPASSISTGLPSDKLLHFSAYLLFSVSLLFGFYHGFSLKLASAFIFAIFISLFTGALTEFLQYSFPELNRTAEWADFFADMIGTLCISFLLIFQRK